jgi:hypothetical protein
MKYEYTAYAKNDEERYQMIAADILSEYPNLGELAYEAAKLERPFGRVHEDYWDFADYENHINRLICIIIVTDGKSEYKNEYSKALKEIKNEFQYWERGFTYANPKEQSAHMVMERLAQHLKDSSVPLITFNDAYDIKTKKAEQKRIEEQYIRDHTMKYEYTSYIKSDEERINFIAKDILREYPTLGELAYEAARLERPFGRVHEDYWDFADYENHINRLINIVIVTEDKEEFQEEHKRACKQLHENIQCWKRGFTYANPEEQPAYILAQRFYEHMRDGEKPLITFNQAHEISNKRNRR